MGTYHATHSLPRLWHARGNNRSKLDKLHSACGLSSEGMLCQYTSLCLLRLLRCFLWKHKVRQFWAQSDLSYITGVTIFDEPETIPESKIKILVDDNNQDTGYSPTLGASHSPKLHRASISGKKMTGRPASSHSNSYSSYMSGSGAPLTKGMSYLGLDDNNHSEPSPLAAGESTAPATTASTTSGGSSTTATAKPLGESKNPDLRYILSQVTDWLQEEKGKRQMRRHHLRHHNHHRERHFQTPEIQPGEPETHDDTLDKDEESSLEKLEGILQGFSNDASKLLRKSSTVSLRKGSIAKKFKQSRTVPASSDTEFYGDDILVPNVEAKLDNTKTMAFTGGASDNEASDKAKGPDHEHWITFKQDILRLTHTLRLKGWRRIPIERATDIEVARLSGALTNAVYVVHPPKNMPENDNHPPQDASTASVSISRRHPTPLLLRIYGPQVEHLIDRDAELNILRRLARKRIGPRLLGTFENGRFEEYLHAETLTAKDLRMPETSKQIAKRMRELHDGIELLESELATGPAVFVNWDKWVDRCEKVISWLDAQVHQAEVEIKAGTSRRNSVVNPRYIRRGLICGVDWPVFRRTYDAYRKRLVADSGGISGIRNLLVFSHNDTQYGNLMRLQPSGTSPLLQPSNQHKQLVVIDFEYAAQNVAGMEFVNHFTEWCYNYHNTPDKSFRCDTRRYPTEQEQYRFVRSYVMHRPQFNPAASATPKMDGREKTIISDFMLDARTPGGGSGASSGYFGGEVAGPDYDKEETERERAQEEEIQRLLQQTRVWRLANTAMWVAWGIVQAKVPELDALEEQEKEAAAAKKERKHERSRSVADKISIGGGKMVGKMKKMVGKEGKHVHPMSDPLTEEEKKLQAASQWDRPEGRAQEEAHHEGDEDSVIEHSDHETSSHAPSKIGPSDDLEHAITIGGNEHSPPGPAANLEGQDSQTRSSSASEPQEEEGEEFDYLAYAQERAMFFWGDCIQMGLVKEEELPEELRKSAKTVPY